MWAHPRIDLSAVVLDAAGMRDVIQLISQVSEGIVRRGSDFRTLLITTL